MYKRNENTHRITLEHLDSKQERFEVKLDAKFDSLISRQERFEAKLDAKFDKFEEKWARERKEEAARHAETMEKMEARLAADRKESEARLAADRKESEARLAADRKESEARQQTTEARMIEERKEARRDYNSQRFWLVANFIAIVIGIGGLYLAFLNGGL